VFGFGCPPSKYNQAESRPKTRPLLSRHRGTSPIRKRSTPYDPPTTLGTGLRQVPRGVRFRMSEVPLYCLPTSDTLTYLYRDIRAMNTLG
jgi:hypothetical protein